jgi:hypothetical protein
MVPHPYQIMSWLLCGFFFYMGGVFVWSMFLILILRKIAKDERNEVGDSNGGGIFGRNASHVSGAVNDKRT